MASRIASRSDRSRRGAALFLTLNAAVWSRTSHKMIVRLGIKRSLRDARVSALQHRGLKPTANRNRSLRDVVVSRSVLSSSLSNLNTAPMTLRKALHRRNGKCNRRSMGRWPVKTPNAVLIGSRDTQYFIGDNRIPN
jgi:hypothetical protein